MNEDQNTMESMLSAGFDPDSIGEDVENLSINEKATYLNHTTRAVLGNFSKISYASSIASKLGKDGSTIRYHIDKLRYLGLIDFYRQTQDRKYYQLTDEGVAVKDKVIIPDE
jgi:DNA-binding transcriptional ArsR family regulator